MTPTDPTPPKASSRQVPTPTTGQPGPGDAVIGHGVGGHAVRGHHHDDHLYDQADIINEDVAHEHSDVNVRAIVASCVGMFAVVGVCAVIVLVLFNFLEAQAAANDPVPSPYASPAGKLPPEPRLLTDEPQNLQRFRDSLAERLKGIDEGKKQFLQNSLPVRADAPADAWMGTHSPSRGESSSGRAIPIRPGDGATPAPGPAVTPAPASPAAPVKGGGH